MIRHAPQRAPDGPPSAADAAVDWSALVTVPSTPAAVIVVADRWTTHRLGPLERRLGPLAATTIPNLFVGRSGETTVLTATAYGAMQAVEPIHVAAALGASFAVLLGSCAALQPDLAVGDVLVAQSVTVGEGASGFYGGAGTAHTDPGLADRTAAALDAAGLTVHRGRVVTGAVTLAQQPRLVSSWAASGHLALDLEASAVLAAASGLGLRAAALLVVDAAASEVERSPGLALTLPTSAADSPADGPTVVGRVVDAALTLLAPDVP